MLYFQLARPNAGSSDFVSGGVLKWHKRIERVLAIEPCHGQGSANNPHELARSAHWAFAGR